MNRSILTSNTILYCQHWNECIRFYKNTLGFEVNFSCDWLVEFHITGTSRVSFADQTRTAIKSVNGQGITLTWQVEDIDEAFSTLKSKGVTTSKIMTHAWGAKLFRFYDPEGHRLEIWQTVNT